MKLNYLTEEEAKMPLDMALVQIALGLQTCKTKGEVVELLKDAVELGRRQERENLQKLFRDAIGYEDYLRMTYTEQNRIAEAQIHYGKEEAFRELLDKLSERSGGGGIALGASPSHQSKEPRLHSPKKGADER